MAELFPQFPHFSITITGRILSFSKTDLYIEVLTSSTSEGNPI